MPPAAAISKRRSQSTSGSPPTNRLLTGFFSFTFFEFVIAFDTCYKQMNN